MISTVLDQEHASLDGGNENERDLLLICQNLEKKTLLWKMWNGCDWNFTFD